MDTPTEFTPEGLPPNTRDMRATFWQKRAVQVPRIQLVHTNGASGIATNQSSKNWLEAAPQSNTCPHYQVQLDGQAAKYLPTDRRGLDNATVAPGTTAYAALTVDQKADILANGQVRNWSIGIETSDGGYGPGKPGDLSGFTEAQIETIAGILAYDSIVWDIPLDYPEQWHGHGTACHTENFEYPFWTLYKGKSCPGSKKKELMRSRVLPRARELRALWTGSPTPPTQEDDMIISTVWTADSNGHQFVTGEDDRALYHRSFAFGAGWSAWESLGGDYVGSPTASVQPDGTLEVYARGTDGSVYQTLFRYTGGGWQTPAVVGTWPG